MSLSSKAGGDGDVSVTKDAEESLDDEFTPSSPIARKVPASRNLVQETLDVCRYTPTDVKRLNPARNCFVNCVV
ncbi:hypothetical protein HDU81_002467 [Chytriomyces hyalinus]|nr:hypothetical protein HDU81_002467 [Chytriomyces hyalinus]